MNNRISRIVRALAGAALVVISAGALAQATSTGSGRTETLSVGAMELVAEVSFQPGLRNRLSRAAGAAAPSGGSVVREATSVGASILARVIAWCSQVQAVLLPRCCW